MKTVQQIFDDMLKADVPNWDGISSPLKALARIAGSVATWLEVNATDIRISVKGIGDAGDGEDWLEVTLRRGGEIASGEFKVGIASDSLPSR
ncbi:MAG: hypothetical protein ACU0A2_15355 [Cognatishimia sp.]|uniref:hypothetical protein n=1 Tax=Cognatishimia sp. TaxID=2211648 RepID=UPI004057D144